MFLNFCLDFDQSKSGPQSQSHGLGDNPPPNKSWFRFRLNITNCHSVTELCLNTLGVFPLPGCNRLVTTSIMNHGAQPKPSLATIASWGPGPHPNLLGQWLNFKLFGITYLVGKIKFKLFFSGSIGWVRCWWKWGIFVSFCILCKQIQECQAKRKAYAEFDQKRDPSSHGNDLTKWAQKPDISRVKQPHL